MIKSNELRVGNWVNYLGENMKFDEIDLSYLFNPSFDMYETDLEPIKLTEEILLSIESINKKIVDNKGLELTIYTINNIELLFTFGILRNIKFMNNKVIIYTAFRDFKIHDLQNLYFVLNGKELEINL